MSEEIMINVTPTETRVALVENGVLQEVSIERATNRGIVGNIYKGKVVRVLPGMQAAFVDIGLERASFIHVADIAAARDPEKGHIADIDIRTVLREGQELVVQVTKDPMGTKGARLTTQLSVSSRYLVVMPGTDHIGVSQRIDEEEERERLRDIVAACRDELELPANFGYIIRTAAEGAAVEEISSDMAFLARLWQAVGDHRKQGAVPYAIHQDLPLAMRTIRDMMHEHVEKIRIDSKETYDKVKEFTHQFVPEAEGILEYYPGERPLFNLYSIEDEIQKALSRKVSLKSGGYIIIDQTEAMTTIDVNTGAFVGHRNLEETIFKTNLEATTALARQLRVRNLGGMIIVDFIDMKDVEHQRQVLRALEKALLRDRAKTNISGVSELGLVQMTRKRTRESLEHILCESCPACDGSGSVKSAETVCYEIFREVLRIARAYESRNFTVLASAVVVDRLQDEDSASVADLEEFTGATIKFQQEILYSQEQFDVILL
ncbi:MAG: ribonuclease G [Pseudomonadales bacterium]